MIYRPEERDAHFQCAIDEATDGHDDLDEDEETPLTRNQQRDIARAEDL